MHTRTAIGLFLGALTLAWGWDLAWQAPLQGGWPWLLRQQGLYLTGIWSIGLMSLAMILALRPRLLERPLGGMDKVYRLHKWAGILAVATGLAHWLIELSKGPLNALAGIAGRPPHPASVTLFDSVRGYAKDLGEWGLYLLLAMLVITLWRRFPYHAWRWVHRAMPLLYLALVSHAAALLPRMHWQGVTGALLGLLMAGGTWGAVSALAGRIGRRRRHAGTVAAVRRQDPGVLEVVCELDAGWPGHKPGQFAFLTLDEREGAHPYTIASAPGPDRRIAFQIKALGDYTRGLAARVQAGQRITVEGPYGCFRPAPPESGTTQVWIAGGIGVTPFLSWLESMQADPAGAPRAHLHYCVRDAGADPFVPRLRALCNALPSVALTVHDSHAGQRLDASRLASDAAGHAQDIWFCGPPGLARTLRRAWRRAGGAGEGFHQEAFEMR
ncbi:ferric reductase [Achromobacter sp. DMS1]|uniref:ferredoxin reductase family protein n=1 Tax=Achromobacter sp. DMS1 TaxID=1688405 RepID=UPI00069F3FC7|nr:ferric reductase-like transmembrane domain-containing protein [Achromobacter sp. DMS1]KOF54388.1 ferric reductase [Achromobacter sp. DMS1]